MVASWAVLLLAPALAAEPGVLCVTKTREPKTLQALVDCQGRKLAKASASFTAKNGAEPSEAQVDQWQDAQRAEVRDYISRHPDRAAMDSRAEPAADAPARPEGSAPAKPDPASKPSEDDARFADSLKASADGGKKGVSPEMARQVTEYLQKRQGSLSPDMRDLLDSLQREGPNLTTETVNKLKAAAQSANSGGMDLKVDDKTKEFLLSPPEQPQAPPTSGL